MSLGHQRLFMSTLWPGSSKVGEIMDNRSKTAFKCILLPPPVVALLFASTNPWQSLVLLARYYRGARTSTRATCDKIFANFPPLAWHEQALRLLAQPLLAPAQVMLSPLSLRQVADQMRAWRSNIVQDEEDERPLRTQVRLLEQIAGQLEGRPTQSVALADPHIKHSAERLLSSFQVPPQCCTLHVGHQLAVTSASACSVCMPWEWGLR